MFLFVTFKWTCNNHRKVILANMNDMKAACELRLHNRALETNSFIVFHDNSANKPLLLAFSLNPSRTDGVSLQMKSGSRSQTTRWRDIDLRGTLSVFKPLQNVNISSLLFLFPSEKSLRTEQTVKGLHSYPSHPSASWKAWPSWNFNSVLTDL